MTTKQRKRLCRIRVERIAKILTFLLVLLTLTVGYVFQIDGYLMGVLSTVVWFFAPDVTAYMLENKYKISHNKTTYR